jgi:antirestriction protein ArdC
VDRSKKDEREIFRAAADAQKIVDMVLGFHPNFAATSEPERPTQQQIATGQAAIL